MEKPIRLYQIVRTKIGNIPCMVQGNLNNLHLRPCSFNDIIHGNLKGADKPIKNGKELYDLVYPDNSVKFIHNGGELIGEIIPRE